MPPEPATSITPPVAALPLDYGSEAWDPLSPVLRTVAFLLFVLGILGFIVQLYYAIVLFGVSFRRTSGFPGEMYYGLGVPLSVFQIIAGAKNMRQLSGMNWIRLWIWATIAIQVIEAIIFIGYDLFIPPHTHIGVSFILNLFFRAIQMPLGCSLALLVLILVKYRERTAALEAPK